MYILFAFFLWNKACTQSLPLGKCYESVIKGLYAFLVFVIILPWQPSFEMGPTLAYLTSVKYVWMTGILL